MNDNPSLSAHPARTLPARPSLEHLKNEAKQRLKTLQVRNPTIKLATAQLAVARDYGFANWRQLKAHIDRMNPDQPHRDQIFAAAQTGDIETVRRAFQAGFDPTLRDKTGRTVHQIAKEYGQQAIELLARTSEERDTQSPDRRGVIDSILDAAEGGDLIRLRSLLDRHPDLIDARGGNFQKQTALHKAAWRNQQACVQLLLARGADVHVRDFGDNATALHFAAEAASIDIVRMLVDAGADVIGEGDDHRLNVIGWATCLQQTRPDIADYLLERGAPLTLWSAIALGRLDDIRRILTSDPSLLQAQMSRNEHRRTPLHHAAARNQPDAVKLLIACGADINARDLTGATALTTAAQEHADESMIAILQQAGARLDLIAAISLKRYDLAETMVRENPSSIGHDGRDTIALHVAASKRNAEAVRWLIDHNIDVNAKRSLWDCNQTALHIAAADGAVDIARMLLDAGGDPQIRDDKYESTPLGWADFCGRQQIAQFLRERGISR
jgi:ankyrin repeat protein